MAKIAIITCFMDFPPGYSLTGIVKDQMTMLTKYGHEVHLFVSEQYNDKTTVLPPGVVLHKQVPFTHLADYHKKLEISPEHKLVANKLTFTLAEELKDIPFAFTHDLVYTGWNLPYGLACKEAGKRLPSTKWLHWVHSVPTAWSDWWTIKEYGSAHKLIYPNESDRIRVAEQYRGELSDVRVIPHIKDIRTFFDFCPDTCEFIDNYPAIMQADIVQVYPASVDRLDAKRVKEVMHIFSKFKASGHSVCLVVAAQWATGPEQKKTVNNYKKIAEDFGLEVDTEVVFTSDFKSPKYDVGVPKNILRELMMLMNVFIFPTREESFGLVLPEAALASGALCVVNKSLSMQLEVSGFHALYFNFGSCEHTMVHKDEDAYMRDIAFIILGRMAQNEAVMTRTYMRQRYNWDALYANYYAPILAESSTWIEK